MFSRRSFRSLLMKRRLAQRMQLPPHFLLGSAIFFEHVTVRADDHGNCFGLQLMHDLMKYADADAFSHGGSAIAFLWSCPHQYNGDDGLRKHDIFGTRSRQATRRALMFLQTRI
jgi:hypothetical protein